MQWSPHKVLSFAIICALSAPVTLRAQTEDAGDVNEGDKEDNIAKTKASRSSLPESQSNSRVTRKEMDIRQPRSAPDALRYEPGVFVQQTAHSQGSAFIRGRTGQQTVLLFDDVRLNNSLFRQGPNQYFFTIDSRTIHHIDITRGSASTRFGTDAIAGAINAAPLEPTFKTSRWSLTPTLSGQYATADNAFGGRLQLDGQFNNKVAVLAGFGARRVGRLESGGVVTGFENDEVPEVPRFEEDGRTQVGTGFDELTGDLRLVMPLGQKKWLTIAYYDYRQFDAPRTDQCPPPEAPFDECLKYDEQFRNLFYTTLEGSWNDWFKRTKLLLSIQKQHERRTLDRPGSSAINGGRDNVTSYGLLWRAQTKAFRATDWLKLQGTWGADLYRDRIESVAWLIFTDNKITLLKSRGQYVNGSTYLTMGAWGELKAMLWDQLIVRAGTRASHIQAQSPGDIESDTNPVDERWSPVVGNVGVEWWVNPQWTVMANIDQGFRAPNLDDMTSRQRTGPGYQLENANLDPEQGITYEVGVRWSNPWIDFDAWGYYSSLDNAIIRATRSSSDCPANTPDCNNSRTYLQLVNAQGQARIWGAEGGVKLRLPKHFQARATLAWAWGDSPNPNPDIEARVPISRIPPLNGTVEGLWSSPFGLYIGTGLRWARAQTRLSVSDVSDARIPRAGTPGFAVLDLRAGYNWQNQIKAHLVFENLTDAAYRYHGSSVNGPARGLSLQVEGRL